MNHPGNRYFRSVVADRKSQYAVMQRTADKEVVAMQVFKAISCQKPPGRFLDVNEDGSYYEVPRKTALAKIKQALREDAEKKTKTSSESKTSKSSKESAKPKSSVKSKYQSSSSRKPSGKGYDKEDWDYMLNLMINIDK